MAVILSEAKDLCNVAGSQQIAWILRFAQDDFAPLGMSSPKASSLLVTALPGTSSDFKESYG
jgi:hypothetical protein